MRYINSADDAMTKETRKVRPNYRNFHDNNVNSIHIQSHEMFSSWGTKHFWFRQTQFPYSITSSHCIFIILYYASLVQEIWSGVSQTYEGCLVFCFHV